MDLPQTAAGQPAAGIDPTFDELASIANLEGVFEWLGASTGVRAALVEALGGGTPRLRDIVYIRGDLWDRTVSGLRVAVSGEGDPRPTSPIEVGHLAMVRRIARLRLGLTAVEVPPATTPVAGGLGLGGGLPQGPPPQGAVVSVAEPRLKLSSILDPVLDTELIRLAQYVVTKLFTEYERKRGAEPAEDIEPTVEQVSAIAQVLKADLAPYACFSIFGPHGRRLLQKLTYLCWTYLPTGAWQRRELPGPPSLVYWWASYRVLRTVYLLLDTVDTETLDNYGELIRGFVNQYGEEAWAIIYTADVRMRAERFQRLRRHAERDHAAKLAANLTSVFDVGRPWNTVFNMAIADKGWWEESVHRPAVLYLARARTEAQLLDDHTAQPALGHSAVLLTRPPAEGGHRRRGRSRSPQEERARPLQAPDRGQQSQVPRPLQPAIMDRDGGDIYTKKGRRFCDDYNTPQGCNVPKCKDLHACKNCKLYGHAIQDCKKRGNGMAAARQSGSGHQGNGRRRS